MDEETAQIPVAKNSNWFLTEKKGLRVLNLKLMMLPLAVNTVILEHICLQTSQHPDHKLFTSLWVLVLTIENQVHLKLNPTVHTKEPTFVYGEDSYPFYFHQKNPKIRSDQTYRVNTNTNNRTNTYLIHSCYTVHINVHTM